MNLEKHPLTARTTVLSSRLFTAFVHNAGRVPVLATLLFLFMSSVARPVDDPIPPIPEAKLAVVRTRLNAQATRGFSGVVMIQRNHTIVFDEAFGSVNGRQARKSDLFWVASISKSFTAAAVMKCREQGLLKLEDHISRYWTDVPRDKQDITVSELLSHTSGLPQSYVSEKIRDRDEAVRAILKEKLDSPPATKFGYSNANYELLAATVEKVSGRRFEEFVQKELLRPLKLMNTGFWFDEQAKRVSSTREPLPARLKQRGWEIGAGGMYSSPEDLLRWSDALWTGKVLSQESTKLIFSDHIKIGEGQAGFGWFHGSGNDGRDFWFTRGNDSFGPNALIYFFPALSTTVVITSHSGDDEKSDMGWSRVALSEVLDVLGF